MGGNPTPSSLQFYFSWMDSMKAIAIALFWITLVTLPVAGSDRRGRRYSNATCTNCVEVSPAAYVGTAKECKDALDEVNAARAKRGLAPYKNDTLLAQGAYNCAKFRAENGIAGHTSNDFAFLPSGGHAMAGGCAAWEPSWGWGSCCAYDNYQTAGAAWVERGGLRYMYLFVR